MSKNINYQLINLIIYLTPTEKHQQEFVKEKNLGGSSNSLNEALKMKNISNPDKLPSKTQLLDENKTVRNMDQ